jgi:hypothetical protein
MPTGVCHRRRRPERPASWLPEDLPQSGFRRLKVGNRWATERPEIRRNGDLLSRLETGDLQEELSAALGGAGIL